MARYLGRELRPDEYVHHKNHDIDDNRIENLDVMSPREHAVHHNQKYPLTKACGYCGNEFTPHKTKRKRQKTCGQACGAKLTWQSRRERGTDKWARI